MMNRAIVCTAIGLLACVIGSPASAAPDTLQRYVQCLSQTRPAQVRQLLQSSSTGAASLTYHALAEDPRCFARTFPSGEFKPVDMTFSQDLLRGRLAEQMLLEQAPAVAALQPLPLQQKRYIRSWFITTGRNPAVDEMGACMADTDPAGILALIKTDRGSSEESAVLADMSPSLTKCLSAGTRLDASRQALRAALADALYQRLSNPSLSLPGTSH